MFGLPAVLLVVGLFASAFAEPTENKGHCNRAGGECLYDYFHVHLLFALGFA
jgi:hypothetical protein